MRFNERDALTHAGKITAGEAEAIAYHRYERFDAKRKENERLQAEEEYLQELKVIEVKTYTASRKALQGVIKG